MAAPVPSLPPDFDQRLMREVRRSSQPLDRYRRILLTGYGLTSVVASAVVMRGQGLDWGAIALMILGPLALVATVPRGAARNPYKSNRCSVVLAIFKFIDVRSVRLQPQKKSKILSVATPLTACGMMPMALALDETEPSPADVNFEVLAAIVAY